MTDRELMELAAKAALYEYAVVEIELLKADVKSVQQRASFYARQRDELLAALNATRGQWIHSANAHQCLAATAYVKESK